MQVSDVINQRISERGITIAELARRVEMDSEILRRCIRGERNLRADEFVRVCVELDLKLDDFGTCAV